MQWKQIVVDGVEYDYEVSNEQGLVRNTRTGRILKPGKTRRYLQVGLMKNKQRRWFYIHRLVAEAFIPNPDNLETVDHIDGNRLNNDASNLQWMTIGDNIEKEQGKKVYCYELNREFKSESHAARETGINQSSISACCQGKQKTAGKYHWKYVES